MQIFDKSYLFLTIKSRLVREKGSNIKWLSVCGQRVSYLLALRVHKKGWGKTTIKKNQMGAANSRHCSSWILTAAAGRTICLPRQSGSRAEVTGSSRTKTGHTNQGRQVCWKKSGQSEATNPGTEGSAPHLLQNKTTQDSEKPVGQGPWHHIYHKHKISRHSCFLQVHL